jgi:hypothetical protein
MYKKDARSLILGGIDITVLNGKTVDNSVYDNNPSLHWKDPDDARFLGIVK